jgi:hypothetical protein
MFNKPITALFGLFVCYQEKSFITLTPGENVWVLGLLESSFQLKTTEAQTSIQSVFKPFVLIKAYLHAPYFIKYNVHMSIVYT